jgi:hypothetical protein
LCGYHYNRKYRQKYFKKWREENKEHTAKYRRKHRKELNKWNQAYNARQRAKVYEHYGNECSCCGEKEWLFLSIDHIKGGGTRHWNSLNIKTMAQVYTWIIKHKYPKSLRLMCFNCNCGRYRNGGICPHKTKGGHSE